MMKKKTPDEREEILAFLPIGCTSPASPTTTIAGRGRGRRRAVTTPPAADRATPAEATAAVLAATRRAGFHRISLQDKENLMVFINKVGF